VGPTDTPQESSVDDTARPARPMPKWRSWLYVALSGVLGVVMGGVTFLVGGVAKLSGNVKHEEVGDLGARPTKIGKALNILIVGSDQRRGANAKYGRTPGERTDTILLAHIPARRDGLLLISFPRDSLVRLPACRATKNFPGQPAHVGMINESFNNGGITCTWRTIESLTGIHIDHFVKVDFTGFKSMVDALGGVEVCLPTPINDPKAMLRLPAGKQVLNGEQALGYVRARYTLGDGSDIGRIQRQQMFLASVAKKALSGDMLTDPATLYRFLDAVTKSVTTDPGLDLNVMKDLALSLKDITADRIRFVTTPWRYSLTNPGRVEWVQPQANRLFRMVAEDRVTGPIKGGEQRIPKSQIHIVVQNGTGRSGLATAVAAQLEQRGYHILKVGNAAAPYQKTVIKYSPNGATRAPRLYRELQQTTTRLVRGARTRALVLVIGADWQGLRPTRAVTDVEGFTATHDTCTATAT